MLHKRIFALVAILFVLILGPMSVYAEGIMDQAAPTVPELYDPAANNAPNGKYFTTYRTNYELDTTAGIFDPVESALNGISNVCFFSQKMNSWFTVNIFYFAFNFSLINMFKGEVEQVVQAAKANLFDQLAPLVLGLLGIYFVMKSVRQQQVQFWAAVIQAVIIVAVGTWFYQNPDTVLTQVDNGMNSVSQMILSGNTKGDASGVVSACDNLWEIYVHRPWLFMEFPNQASASKNGETVLNLEPGSPERKSLIKNLKNSNEFKNQAGNQIGFMFFSALPSLICQWTVIILSGIMIGFQFMVLFFFLLGIVAFPLALWPGKGPKILASWMEKVLWAAGMKIILSFILTLIISFTKVLASNYWNNWLGMIFLQTIMYLVFLFNYKAIMKMFRSLRHHEEHHHHGGLSHMGHKLMHYGRYYADRYMRGGGGSSAAPARASHSGTVTGGMRRNADATPNLRRSTQPPVRTANLALAPVKSGVPNIPPAPDGMPGPDGSPGPNGIPGMNGIPGQDGRRQPARETQRIIYRTSEILATKPNAQGGRPQTMRARQAELILERQVDFYRNQAEQEAQRTGNKPEYHPMVKMMEAREKMGMEPFSQKEVSQIAREIDRVEQRGGNFEDIAPGASGIVAQKKQRPESLIQVMNEKGTAPRSGNLSRPEPVKAHNNSMSERAEAPASNHQNRNIAPERPDTQEPHTTEPAEIPIVPQLNGPRIVREKNNSQPQGMRYKMQVRGPKNTGENTKMRRE